jgi:hypothetical protein
VTHVDEASPAVTHADEASPAVTHADEASPAVTHADEASNRTFGSLRQQPKHNALVRMHALQGLACRARVTPASSHASPCLTSPACHTLEASSCQHRYMPAMRVRVSRCLAAGVAVCSEGVHPQCCIAYLLVFHYLLSLPCSGAQGAQFSTWQRQLRQHAAVVM